jgi:LuxR family transcriptional regulator, maltose regulon positive regulatory protein
MQNYKHIKTKFVIPKVKSKIINRDKILNKLDKALAKKLTIISAPAGSGKTTSVVSWIYSRNLSDNTMWISLDEREDKPEVFWNSFIRVVEKFKNNDFQYEETSFDNNQNISIEVIIDMLLNDISMINKDLIFVIDDFHFIKNKDIIMGIKYFIDNITDNIHFIITSRMKSTINLAKLRINREVAEMDSKELKFSLSETSQFLKDNMNLDIKEESVKTLNECAEGWAAGLQISTLLMKKKTDIVDIAERFCGGNKYVQDYFCEEVFNNLSEEIKEFLLKTCILDELTTDLCNAVACKNNSQQMLKEIYDMNLFIEKLDYSGERFRYHNLFKEFLTSISKGVNKEQVYEANNMAGKWYETNGLINKAVDQYIKAENFEQVVSLIEDSCIKKILSNEYFYVISWLESIPQDIILKNPRFCITYMYIYIYDDVNYYRYLEFTEKILENYEDGDYKEECLGILLIVKGDKSLIKSEYKNSIEHYQNALNYFKNNTFWNTIINLKLGVVYFYLNDLVLEKKNFDEAILLSQSYHEDNLYLVVNRTILLSKLLRGQLVECESICNIFLNNNIYDELKKSPLMAPFYIALALVCYEKNEIDNAENYVLNGINLMEKEKDFDTNFYILNIGYYVYSGIVLEKNDKGQINKIYKKIESLSEKYKDNRLCDRYYFNKLKVYVEALKMERLLELGKISIVERNTAEKNFKIDEEYIIFCKVLILKGKIDDALMLLNKLLASIKEQNSIYVIVKAYIYRIEIFCRKGQLENAAKDLREALIIGYENGFIRPFLFKSIKMSKTLLKTIKGMKFKKDYYKMEEYSNKILALYSTEENNEIISKREKQVLQLIEKGAKNSEIAEKLFISESTTKSHILNIFSKLGVHNRVQAVAKAKEIGII